MNTTGCNSKSYGPCFKFVTLQFLRKVRRKFIWYLDGRNGWRTEGMAERVIEEMTEAQGKSSMTPLFQSGATLKQLVLYQYYPEILLEYYHNTGWNCIYNTRLIGTLLTFDDHFDHFSILRTRTDRVSYGKKYYLLHIHKRLFSWLYVVVLKRIFWGFRFVPSI